jgi:3-oxoacyl-[acyl-carrier protein] reductase
VTLSYDFRGRTAVVTGAARGIGYEIARLFTEGGATVYIADFDPEETVSAAERLGARPLIVDVSSPSVGEVIDQVVDEAGSLDILVNNAGILRDGVLWKMTDADWQSVLDVHLTGTFRLTRAAVTPMRAQGFGRIVNVTSYSGMHGNFGQANYAAAKAGIIGFTKTAAKELANFGITVNAISPNAQTRMISSIPDAKLAELTALIPVHRFAEPHEIASGVGFLASDEAAYITGVVLPIDGGVSM